MLEPHTATAPTLSLAYRLRMPTAGAGKSPLIIFLHGYGSNEADLFAFANIISPEFLVLSARAPILLGTAQYAWYPLDWSSGAPVGDAHATEAARLIVKKFIDEVIHTFAVDTSQIFLLGFSQGAIMGCAVSLTSPRLLRGVIALSGRVLDETKRAVQVSPALLETSYFIGHGTQDQVLPVLHAREAKKYLESLGVPLEYHEYVTPHGVPSEEVAHVRAWLLGIYSRS